MKKITLLLLFFLISLGINSQCTTITGGNYGNRVMVNDGTAEQIALDNWPNAEYSAIEDLIIGNNYTVTATNTTSMYITVAEIDWDAPALGGTVLAHGASSVSFTATTLDVIIHWHLDALCNTQASDDTLTTIQCTSASCSCTAAAAPDAAMVTYPADGATDIPIDMSDPANPSINGFAWTDNGEATAYDWTLVGVGTASGVANPVDINYSWAYDTTYTWNITSTNCLGTITSVDFTFTTGSDPLSVDDVQRKSFKHYYDLDEKVLTMESEGIPFDNIRLYNILGQEVIYKNLSQTSEAINMSSLKDGIYLAKVTLGGSTQTIKVIKK